MIVQHNLTAMNANRMFGITNKKQAKSTEKLSSGYKINRAADNAAGLSISEKMRKQIRGLKQASANAQDGISAVQTAEGALTEVHDMLQRMNELAVKAANGTNSQSDRTAIQAEINQLKEEINRVSETTKFNETYLLKGETSIIQETKVQLKGTPDTTPFIRLDDGFRRPMVPPEDYISIDPVTNALSPRYPGATYYEALKIAGLSCNAPSSILSYIDGKIQYAAQSKYIFFAVDSNQSLTVITNDNCNDFLKMNSTLNIASAKAGYDVYYGIGNILQTTMLNLYEPVTTDVVTDIPTSIDLHVGADSSSENKINIKLAPMNAKSLGVSELSVETANDATNAIDSIASAIQKVSEHRSYLGAIQNRLEHTICNLDNVVENTTAAESQIRDTDMATEMVAYSNNSILAQAGQAMLTQANQLNQGVLSLLR